MNMNMNIIKTTKHLFIVCLLTLLTISKVSAGAESSARALGMGGAFSGLAKGVDAARYNPANLGFVDYQKKSIELFGIGANISNNSFTLADYNNYTGAFLSEADKSDILNKIPQEGLNFKANVHASALSFSIGAFAVSNEISGDSYININKDLINLILNGNTFADTISFEGTYSEAIAYATTSFSYGRTIYSMGTREIAIGASLKYITGLGIEQIVEMNGSAVTLMTGIEGQGKLIANSASGGSGYGLDLGASIKLNNSYTAGLSIKNLISSINWTSNPEEIGYIFNFDSVTIDNIDQDFVVADDYSKPIDPFTSSLPSVMVAGIAKTSGELLWAVDWEQGFSLTAGSSSKPRISAGVEWNKLKFLPLRTGFSIGGDRYTSFSAGSGLKFGFFHIDFAAVTGSSFSSGSSKGLIFAVSSGFTF